MTLICVPIMVEDLEQAARDAREARDVGADLVEFRVDPYYTGDDDAVQVAAILKLVKACPIACIVTCRPVLEGGQYDGDEQSRISLYERLGTATGAGETPPRYLDVELATYGRSANIKQKVNLAVDHPGQVRSVDTGLILSAHDFHSRPKDLLRRIEQMGAEPACKVVKVAYRARSIRDNIELLDLTYEASQGALGGKPMIALGMGPFGLMSRVLCPKFGGFLTFASLRRTSASAPGQPTTDELMNLYRFKSIGASTKVYGVIGYPVEHSLSPLIHNAGFDAVEHDGVYLPMPVPPEYEHFKATVLALIDHVNLDFCGCSVTIPHKEHLVRLAREQIEQGDDRWSIDRLSERCGAANTLVVRRTARGVPEQMSVMNTDGPAVAGLLRGISNKRVALLGTGGTTRAIAAALVDEGWEVLVVSRGIEKSRALAEVLSAKLGGPGGAARVNACEPDKLPENRPGVVINCTPVGMRTGPDPNGMALAKEILRNLDRSCVVSDCVYNPLRTPLLEEAEATGHKAIGGLEMFVAQAAGQFESWTGRTAPSRLFETIVRETLESRA